MSWLRTRPRLEQRWAYLTWGGRHSLPWAQKIEVTDPALSAVGGAARGYVLSEVARSGRSRVLVAAESVEILRRWEADLVKRWARGGKDIPGDDSNVILAPVCRTDAELRERAGLLRPSMAVQCPALVLEPTERMDLATALLEADLSPRWVLIRAPQCESRPMHSTWIERAISDAHSVGVPVWFEGWGDWIPYDGGAARRHEEIIAVYADGSRTSAGQRRRAAGFDGERRIFRPGGAKPEINGRTVLEEPPPCS